MPKLERLFPSDWGSVRIGSRQVPTRLLVIVAGASLWLGLMLIETGRGGVSALWTNLLLLAPLLVLCSATRTLTIRDLSPLFFLGGFLMGIALLVGKMMDPHAAARAFLIPLVEETLKIAPVVFLLWRWRTSRTLNLGVTDVLLMAVVCGAGFGLVEDAYIRDRRGWPGQLDWLPVTEIIRGRIIAGHAIWTALAGITIGLGLLLRGRAPVAMAVAASGFGVSALDHIANNYGNVASGSLARFLNTISAHGYLVIYLFVLGVIGALVLDLYVAYGTLPRLPELKRPQALKDLGALWNFALAKRELAYAVFRFRNSSGLARAESLCVAALLDAWFINLSTFYLATPTTSSESPAASP